MNSYEDPFLSETCDLYCAMDERRELIRELVEALERTVRGSGDLIQIRALLTRARQFLGDQGK